MTFIPMHYLQRKQLFVHQLYSTLVTHTLMLFASNLFRLCYIEFHYHLDDIIKKQRLDHFFKLNLHQLFTEKLNIL